MQSVVTAVLDQFYFVGREKAIQEFEKFLTSDDKRVFFILGEGGIGKTWLLRRLMQLTRQRYPDWETADEITDLIATQYHRIEGLRSRVIEMSGREREFHTYLREFRRLTEFREENQGFSYAKRPLRDKDASVQALFYEACKQAFAKRGYILWLDTFEVVYQDPVGYWLLDELPRNAPHTRLVIAGRKQGGTTPDPDLVETYTLQGLNPAYIHYFYQRRYTTEPDTEIAPEANPQEMTVWTQLCAKLDYHPLYLDLARLWADARILDYNTLVTTPKEDIIKSLFTNLRRITRVPGVISEEMESKYSREDLLDIEIAAYDVILYMAFFNRRFDERFLEAIYPTSSLVPSLEHARVALHQMIEVPNIFFIKKREGGLEEQKGYLQLHDAVCEHVMETLWPQRDPMGEERTYLRKRAIAIYNELIQKTTDPLKREELKAEQLGYVLSLDFPRGYQSFKESFNRNLKSGNLGVCQLLLNELSRANHTFSLPERHEIQNFKFQLALSRNDFEGAKLLVRTPEQGAQYLLSRQEFLAHNTPKEALKYAQQAFELAEQRNLMEYKIRAQRALGLIYRILGEWETAIYWYRQCQETARLCGGEKNARIYAQVLNNEGYAWALMGKYDLAFEIVTNALFIRKELGKPFDIGQSLSTLGEIARLSGDFHQADQLYRDALNYFEAIRAFDWQAIVWHQRADNARRNAKRIWEQQLVQDKSQIRKYVNFAQKDIQLSLNLYRKYQLRRERLKAWLRLGLIYRDQSRLSGKGTNPKDLTQALNWLKKAFALAQESGEDQEALDCLIYIAGIEIWQRQFSEANETLEKIDDFRRAYNYLVFCGLREIHYGEIALAQGRFDDAKALYVKGLVSLAHQPGYGHVRLGLQIDDLRRLLQNLPTKEERREWCKDILRVWRETGLNKSLPRAELVVQGILDILTF